MISFKVTIHSIEARKGQKTTYRVRWVVAGNRFGESFTTKQLAEAYRATLITAAGNGEGFNTETGLPVSMDRKRRDVSFYQHALDFTVAAWPAVAAKSRGGSPSGLPNSATTASTSLTYRPTRVSGRASPRCSDKNSRAPSHAIDTNAGQLGSKRCSHCLVKPKRSYHLTAASASATRRIGTASTSIRA